MRSPPGSLILEPTFNPFSLENDTPTKLLFSIDEFLRTPATPRVGVPSFGEAINPTEKDIAPPTLCEASSTEPTELDQSEENYWSQSAAELCSSIPDYEYEEAEAPQLEAPRVAAIDCSPSHGAAPKEPAQPPVVDASPSFPAVEATRSAGSQVKSPWRCGQNPEPVEPSPYQTYYDLIFQAPKVSPEEMQRRADSEAAFKKLMQDAELTPFQQRYLNEEKVRDHPLMTQRNSKKCATCGIVPSTMGRYAFHHEDHGCKREAAKDTREYCEFDGCPYMAIGFNSRQTLSRHKSSVHMGVKHTCKLCSRQFARKDGLIRHTALGTCKKDKKKSKGARKAEMADSFEPGSRTNGPKRMPVVKKPRRPRKKGPQKQSGNC